LDLGTGGILTETVYDRILSDLYRLGGADGDHKTGNLIVSGTGYIDFSGMVADGGLRLPASSGFAPTVDGSIGWDTDDDLLKIGTGTTSKTFVDTNSAQALSGPKTLTSPIINTPSSAGQVYGGISYTDTLVMESNCTSGSVIQLRHARNGAQGRVFGFLWVQPTATGLVEVGVPLPVASNLSGAADCIGSVVPNPTNFAADALGWIVADTTNDRARIVWVANGTTAVRDLAVSFDYAIL